MTRNVPPEILSRAHYYAALDDLATAARRFAHAIDAATKAARAFDPNGNRPDDDYALRTLDTVRNEVLGAFARSPGMIQVFSTDGRVKETLT